MKLKQLKIKPLDYKCLACGKPIPKGTHTIYHRGDHYIGSHTHEVPGVDRYQDAFKLREISNVLEEIYTSTAEKLLESEKKALKKEVKEAVQGKEFKKIVIDRKVEELSKEYEKEIKNFKEFLGELHYQGRSFIPYFVDAQCAEAIMQAAEKVEKEKYAVNKGKETIAIFNAEMTFPTFLKSFGFLTNQLHLHELQPQEEKIITIEFRHFSDYYYMR